MSDEQPQPSTIDQLTAGIGNTTDDLQRRDNAAFRREIDTLIREAENTRLEYMRRFHNYKNLAAWLGMLSCIAGSLGFAWLFLVKFSPEPAILAFIAGSIPYFGLNFVGNRALKDYRVQHKTTFMPKLAKILGGFRFFAEKGLSKKVLSKTGILPSFKHYHAEDCFRGTYKGVKVTFCEAKLYKTAKPRASSELFCGIFVFLEIPHEIIDGHTIITADHDASKRWHKTRWSKFTPVIADTENAQLQQRFEIFSTEPDSAGLLVGEKLLKELYEASEVFNGATLSMALFGRKYIFAAIPHDNDMFEASDIRYPLTTQVHAMRCKQEVDQILEIIDVFEMYKS